MPILPKSALTSARLRLPTGHGGAPKEAATSVKPVSHVPEHALPDLSEVVSEGFDTTSPLFANSERRKGPHPRHHFILLDGTWNEERDLKGRAATPTNVLRLFQEIAPSANVVARYYRGVGSRQDNTAANRLWFGFNGKDEERIRSAAFADLYLDYQRGDSIYIIGFSRGAASARLLARDICVKGLPPKLRVHKTHFSNLLTRQVESRIDRVQRLDEGNGENNYRPSIAFLGCWDTVDAFVLPMRYPSKDKWQERLLDGTVRLLKSSIPRILGKERFRGNEHDIPPNVAKAVHCVAIDETRHAFLPTLMPHAENVEEVWFPGVHADVGGGYEDNMLAEAPYQFIKDRLRQTVADPDLRERLSKRSEFTGASAEYTFHFHGLNVAGRARAQSWFGFGASMRRIRVMGGKGGELPKLHASVLSVSNSPHAYAADRRNRRTWTVTYDPYNVSTLQGAWDLADLTTSDAPEDRSLMPATVAACPGSTNLKHSAT